MWVSLNCLSVNANLKREIGLLYICDLFGAIPSESQNLRDLPLKVWVASGAPPQPGVELLWPVRATRPLTPQDITNNDIDSFIPLSSHTSRWSRSSWRGDTGGSCPCRLAAAPCCWRPSLWSSGYKWYSQDSQISNFCSPECVCMDTVWPGRGSWSLASHGMIWTGRHNCNAQQSEGRVRIFKYNLQMQVIGALFASYLQTLLF